MVDDKLTKRIKTLETLIALSIVFTIISLVLGRAEFAYGSLLLLLSGLLFKKLASIIALGWLRFSTIVGIINTTIILSLMFYLILTPIAILYRLCCRNPLHVKRTESDDSYFHFRNHVYNKRDLENIW